MVVDEDWRGSSVSHHALHVARQAGRHESGHDVWTLEHKINSMISEASLMHSIPSAAVGSGGTSYHSIIIINHSYWLNE